MSRNVAVITITTISCLRCSGAISELGYDCSMFAGEHLKRMKRIKNKNVIFGSIEEARFFLHSFSLN